MMVSLMASRVAAMSAGLSSWRCQASCSVNTRGGVSPKYRSTVFGLPQPPACHIAHNVELNASFLRAKSSWQLCFILKLFEVCMPSQRSYECAQERFCGRGGRRWSLTFIGVAALFGGNHLLQQRAQLGDAAACRRLPKLRGRRGEEALQHRRKRGSTFSQGRAPISFQRMFTFDKRCDCRDDVTRE